MGLFCWRKPRLVWHIPEGRDDLIPRRATDGSMAFDMVSPGEVIVPRHDVDLGVGSALVDTLVVATIPTGYALVLRSRSGLANKQGITVEAGEIDSDYRGLIKVLLFNHSGADYVVEAGDRIAQIRIIKIHELKSNISYKYPDPNKTERGASGFGSTGR